MSGIVKSIELNGLMTWGSCVMTWGSGVMTWGSGVMTWGSGATNNQRGHSLHSVHCVINRYRSVLMGLKMLNGMPNLKHI